MKKYISLYLYNIKVFMMAQMSFRVDFFIGLFSSLIEQIVYLIFLNILFGNIKGTSNNTNRASRASNLSLIYSLFLVNFCL